MRNTARLTVALAVLAGLVGPVSFGGPVGAATKAPKLNASCTAKEVGKTSGKLVCTKAGSGQRWQNAPAATTVAPTAAPTTAAAAAPDTGSGPKPGGKMIIGIDAESSAGWTPSASAFPTAGAAIRRTMIESLIEPNSKAEPECYLCETITPNAAYDEWTIKLRPGIKFHNGEALDAEAVRLNFEDLRKAGAVTATLLRPISSMTVIDPLRLKVSLSSRFVNFPASLVLHQSAMVAPAQLKDPNGRSKPIGTGPYKFKEWVLNDRITVVKNDAWWRKDVTPYLDEITFRVITDDGSRLTAFKAGDIQGMMTVNYQNIGELRSMVSSKKAVLNEFDRFPGITHVMFGMTTFPFNDLRVRQAVMYALDRGQINEINNFGVPGLIDTPFQPEDANKAFGLYPKPDASKAKALIDAVEKETGKKVEFEYLTTATPESIQQAEVIASFLNKAGMSVKVRALESATLIRQAQIGQFQMMSFRFQSNLDPEDGRRNYHSENATALGTVTTNYMRWRNGIVDSAFETLRGNTDPAVRKRAASFITTEMVNDLPLVILNSTLWATAVSPNYGFAPATLPSGKPWQTSPTGAMLPMFIYKK